MSRATNHLPPERPAQPKPHQSSRAICAIAAIALLGLGTAVHAQTAAGATPARDGAAMPGPAAVEGHVTTHDGLRLVYRKVGNGPQTIVVPFGFAMRDFERLASPERTLVFYDQRNRGRSGAVPGDKLSIHDEVRDMETLRVQLGIERFTTIGYSYLGLMTALYAMEHPDRVERLVQLGPVPMRIGTEYPPDQRSDDWEEVTGKERLAELARLEKEGLPTRNPKEFCERQWAAFRLGLVVDQSKVAALGSGHCDLPNEWPNAFAQMWPRRQAEFKALDMSPARVARISKPVLVIHGRKDRNAAYGAGREWASKLPDARLLTLDRAAHQLWVDEPEIAFGAIDTFLRGRWPERAERIAPR
jgi:proline iminopeptidase